MTTSPTTNSPQQDTMLRILASPRVKESNPRGQQPREGILCDYEGSVIIFGHLFLDIMYEISKWIKLVEMKWISISSFIDTNGAENKRSMFDRKR